IIRQFPVALREIRITLANTNQTVHGQLLRNVMATTKRNFTRLMIITLVLSFILRRLERRMKIL
ncbi:hypothetical protein MJL81_29675, partial [Salmonella enterica subsp. enterica serovar Anatum]|nr:hypothetical protein [Salmonella enterica subsp. enterica serovar Anatum]